MSPQDVVWVTVGQSRSKPNRFVYHDERTCKQQNAVRIPTVRYAAEDAGLVRCALCG